MPAKFIIHGARTLSGRLTIQGSKNTALPLIAACLLTTEPCVLENVPDISDVATMLSLIEGLGATAAYDPLARTLEIEARALTGILPDETLARKLRGSILIAGALLGRRKKAELPYPGGDAIGARPLQTHFHALKDLGVIIEEGERVTFDGGAMRPGEIRLEESSVTATENTLLAAVAIPGVTTIRLAAFEPHVQELIQFLRRMGADIRQVDWFGIEVRGGRELRGARYRLNPDDIEIAGFAALAAATQSELLLSGIEPKYLDAVFLQLHRTGVAFEKRGADLRILKPPERYKSFRIQSGLYPKLMSDYVPPFAVLATQADGESLIHEWLYENRLRYIPELQKMGANCTILDPHRALISGPTALTGNEISSFDIRSGMTMIIASLVAAGQSTITNIEHIDRGYEKIDERLRAIGADIQRVNE